MLKFNTHKNFPEDDGFGTTLSTVGNLGRRLDVDKLAKLLCKPNMLKNPDRPKYIVWQGNAEYLAEALSTAYDKGLLTEDV